MHWAMLWLLTTLQGLAATTNKNEITIEKIPRAGVYVEKIEEINIHTKNLYITIEIDLDLIRHDLALFKENAPTMRSQCKRCKNCRLSKFEYFLRDVDELETMTLFENTDTNDKQYENYSLTEIIKKEDDYYALKIKDIPNVRYDRARIFSPSHIHKLLLPSENETLLYTEYNTFINKFKEITTAAKEFLMRLIDLKRTGKMVDKLLDDKKLIELTNKMNDHLKENNIQEKCASIEQLKEIGEVSTIVNKKTTS